MTIQQFIEKIMKGGGFYFYDHYYRSRDKMVKFHMLLQERAILEDEHGYKHRVPISDIFLSPFAWQAVGKVSGWSKDFGKKGNNVDEAIYYMHSMIDALVEGKTPEQFIETL